MSVHDSGVNAELEAGLGRVVGDGGESQRGDVMVGSVSAEEVRKSPDRRYS